MDMVTVKHPNGTLIKIKESALPVFKRKGFVEVEKPKAKTKKAK